jgi:hypothetical protein
MDTLSCYKCGRHCKDKRGLKVHETRCQHTVKLKCSYCSSFFDTNESLNSHLEQCKAIKETQERIHQSFVYQSKLEEKDKLIKELQEQNHTLQYQQQYNYKQENINQTNQIELLQSLHLNSIQSYKLITEEKDRVISILEKNIVDEQNKTKLIEDTLNQLKIINDELRLELKKDKDIIYELAFNILNKVKKE